MARSKPPLVSFVVPCYNYGRYLGECLSSIFSQEGVEDFEVIVIDDGSTDHTQEMLSSFTDRRLQVITHSVNLGHVATINEGLSLARGTFIARMDPDDRYRPYFLSALLPIFEAFPEVGLVYGDVAIINELGEITAKCSDQVHGNRDFKGNELVPLLEKNFVNLAAVIARREVWQVALPVPAGLAFHDWYFTVTMARKHKFYYINRVLAEYRVHPENHHSKVIKNKSEEPSIFWLLSRIFNETEKDLQLEEQKQRAKGRIYGAQYLDMATKYFGCGYNADARRCYLQALRHRPAYVLNPGVPRRLLGTIIGQKVYEFIRSSLKTVTVR